MTQIKSGTAVAVFALAIFPTKILGQPVVCVPPTPDYGVGNPGFVVIDDEWQVTVEPSGQIYLNDRKVSRSKLKEDAVAWAQTGTWPIVVRGHTGTRYEQITSIVTMLRKTGVWTKVSCVSPEP